MLGWLEAVRGLLSGVVKESKRGNKKQKNVKTKPQKAMRWIYDLIISRVTSWKSWCGMIYRVLNRVCVDGVEGVDRLELPPRKHIFVINWVTKRDWSTITRESDFIAIIGRLWGGTGAQWRTTGWDLKMIKFGPKFGKKFRSGFCRFWNVIVMVLFWRQDGVNRYKNLAWVAERLMVVSPYQRYKNLNFL